MSQEPQVQTLDNFVPNSVPKFAEVMPRVVSEHNKSLSEQLREIAKLSFRNNKLRVDEYYKHNLYDDTKFSAEDKKTFVGISKSREIWGQVLKVNPWYGFLDDKFKCELLLFSCGINTTKTRAVCGIYTPGKSAEMIDSAESLRGFLKNATYPLFGKPLDALGSKGAALITGYEVAGNRLILSDNRKIDLELFWNEIGSNYDGKYLFQETLKPHKTLHAMCKSGVSTVRLVTVDRGNGPEIFRACIKLTGGDNVADNFWRTGNMIAPVDAETGKMGAAATSFGIDGEYVDMHPASGIAIAGAQLPFWKETRELAVNISKFFDGALLIGYDIALTDNGPVIVEINNNPDFEILQIAHQKGILEQPILDMMEHAKAKADRAAQKLKTKVAKQQEDYSRAMKDAVSRKVA